MELTASHLVFALLLGLGYLLVTCTLGTLASRVRQQRTRHDLLLASRQRRREYLDAIAERMGHTVEAE